MAFSRNNLTIHVEEQEARALVMAGNQVVRWTSIPIPRGVIIGGVVVDPKVLAKLLRELVEQVHARKMKPLVSLGGLHPVVRVLNLPRLKRGLLVQAIQGEMRRELPSRIEDYEIKWVPLESSKTEVKVYVLALPSNELVLNVISSWAQSRSGPEFAQF